MRAKFNFDNFKVIRTLVDLESYSQNSENPISSKINIKGIQNRDEKTFQLDLALMIEDTDSTLKIKVFTRSQFHYESDLENLLDFFSKNAPAIVFPYIRSYITTLTAISGLTNPITIPTINLTDECNCLKNNILVI